MSEHSRKEQQIAVVDNPAEHQFEAHIDGRLALVSYIRTGDTITLTHTEVPKELQGRGIGNVLAREVFAQTKRAGVNVVVRCPFLMKFIERHPEYSPVQARH